MTGRVFYKRLRMRGTIIKTGNVRVLVQWDGGGQTWIKTSDLEVVA